MPTLALDIDAEPWALLATLSHQFAIPSAVSPSDSIAYLTYPRRVPAELESPLRVSVAGRTPASLMTYERGFGATAVTDLIASPALAALLRREPLPAHQELSVLAEVHRGIELRPDRRYPDPMPFVWFWWTVPWERVDFSKTTFQTFDRDGVIETANFAEYDDYEAVRRRGVRTGVAVVPTELAYRGASPPDGDLELCRPRSASPAAGPRTWRISNRLAEQISGAKLPGLIVSESPTPGP